MSSENKEIKIFILSWLKPRIRGNAAVFLFFLILSFILWYLNSLRKEMDLNVRFPITYINQPDNFIFAEEPPLYIYLKLHGPGYSLINTSPIFRKRTLNIDLSSVKIEKMNVVNSLNGYYYLISESLIPYFTHQLHLSSVEIVSIKPDTLFLSIIQNPYFKSQSY